MMLGNFEVTALDDGTIALPADELLTKTTPARVRRALSRWYQKSPLATSVNAFLINTGGKLVLVDAGTSNFFGPTLGKLAANPRAAGYAPEQIDRVLVTHLHADHIGGLLDGERLAFPNATVHVDRHDLDHWLSQAQHDQAPADQKNFYEIARKRIGPVQAAGRLQAFDGDTELAPGVRAVAAHGHTPGHTIYVVESRGEKLALRGDLMHVGAVEFADPGVTIRFDTDSRAAAAQRRKAYAAAAREGH